MAWQLHAAVEARAGAPLVVDDEGHHAADDVLERPGALPRASRAATGVRPTVAAEATNDWRTVAVALAVARLDGTLALLPSGLGRREAELALEDVAPDVLVASADAAAQWTDGLAREAGLDDRRLVALRGGRGDA